MRIKIVVHSFVTKELRKTILQEDSAKTNCFKILEIAKNVYNPLSKHFINSFYYFKFDIGTMCDKKIEKIKLRLVK